MKTKISIIILAAASIFAAISCHKEPTASGTKAGETLQISINASLGDLVSADNVKATAKSVVRLEWANGDKVQAYCGTTKISTGDGLTVTPSENKLFASLTGKITAPKAGKTITFVYSNGCSADGLSFDFSSQTNGIPFVAYGTLVYDGKDIKDKMVEFKFATSVMKIAATDLVGGTISNATISGINTKVTLTPSESANPTISGNTSGSISTSNFETSSDGTRAIITVGLVPENGNAGRKLSVTQGVTQTTSLTSTQITGSTSYYTPCTFGSVFSTEYVTIGGLKWAKCNIGATTETGFGYYFAWGGTEGYVYRDEKWVKASDGSKLNGGFNLRNSPYYTNPAYTKYTKSDSKNVLESGDDAATAYLGTGWRIPNKEDFENLYNTCLNGNVDYTTYASKYCNSTDNFKQGVYMCNKYDGVEGLLFVDSSGNKLFFPAAGYGNDNGLSNIGYGYYWSRTLCSSDTSEKAYNLTFSPDVYLNVEDFRYRGFTVRPVSD